jgi:membrane-bound ClpP family serine protease
VAVSVATTGVGLWLLARSRAARRMVLTHHNPGESADTDGLRRLVGHTGVTTCDLRPTGTAEIDGARHQVTSGGDWLPAGTPVRVTRVGTFSLFVEKLEPRQTEPGDNSTTELHHGR